MKFKIVEQYDTPVVYPEEIADFYKILVNTPNLGVYFDENLVKKYLKSGACMYDKPSVDGYISWKTL